MASSEPAMRSPAGSPPNHTPRLIAILLADSYQLTLVSRSLTIIFNLTINSLFKYRSTTVYARSVIVASTFHQKVSDALILSASQLPPDFPPKLASLLIEAVSGGA